MQERGLRIRKMALADITAVQGIERSSFPDPWARETLEEAITTFSDTVFIAESEGSICGYIICGVEDTGEERYGHICSLAVSPDMRNRGIGKTLVKRAEQAAMIQKATAMQLEVRVSNISAIQFYTKLGYEPVFQICGYYADTEDAIVMMRWFRF
ncbi:ribosomal protein S18-alanine N-acetyltransferase [Methanospirillum hungatei]|jgi:ribosomal-protein-alanine N-acetyltransferase|uniref:ribosomal protein S18-alanine N-acetyltransferase n=1 Tax=Methanospirillum hungatei TaxID=2203 RepID=UPI0009D4AF7A|nr:ribosomal protein S18-alanine N-acetyltransferase [Methanospirillum hungatei]MBP7034246.1 ribosomal protein S18-alanine N-acetyltransferase [Methanospirillum sp.]OQA55698.1 MAG: putative N-acetyltransferase [Euryarchaeota archaeon ADurb.Bin294]MBP9007698.1 ribosomal protein S18-alanine N-acetyltransferase [Methanospirillum sp.]MCA1916183.1 ribosomal protein S18-alanine N-acetyltransferase [Methanospirillum hungatei]HOW04314.1 ribosomal protein S18-alanine N-acetyltransferase [Methanospirill